jgi:hypothetical protein
MKFPLPNREVIEERLLPGTLSTHEDRVIWGFMLRCSDPSEVAHTYRNYRDSPHCNVPREKLRSMRDALIVSMREANRETGYGAKEKRKKVHYPDYENDRYINGRKSA